MKEKIKPVSLIKRLVVFCIGQLILALGVVVAVKSALGASPTTGNPTSSTRSFWTGGTRPWASAR